jgi:hypothetical protein
MNTHTAIMQQLTQTARMLEAEWRQVLLGSMGTGAKKNKSTTGHMYAPLDFTMLWPVLTRWAF